MGLVKIPFSNLLQFNPMGETRDPDGDYSFSFDFTALALFLLRIHLKFDIRFLYPL